MISLHCDWEPSGRGSGAATYYYGSARTASMVGRRFAELLQEHVVERTGLRDCRTHAKTWDLLRLTRMPAVRPSRLPVQRQRPAKTVRSTSVRRSPKASLQPCTTSSPRSSNPHRAWALRCSGSARGTRPVLTSGRGLWSDQVTERRTASKVPPAGSGARPVTSTAGDCGRPDQVTWLLEFHRKVARATQSRRAAHGDAVRRAQNLPAHPPRSAQQYVVGPGGSVRVHERHGRDKQEEAA